MDCVAVEHGRSGLSKPILFAAALDGRRAISAKIPSIGGKCQYTRPDYFGIGGRVIKLN
jgi:hypothetical protein